MYENMISTIFTVYTSSTIIFWAGPYVYLLTQKIFFLLSLLCPHGVGKVPYYVYCALD